MAKHSRMVMRSILNLLFVVQATPIHAMETHSPEEQRQMFKTEDEMLLGEFGQEGGFLDYMRELDQAFSAKGKSEQSCFQGPEKVEGNVRIWTTSHKGFPLIWMELVNEPPMHEFARHNPREMQSIGYGNINVLDLLLRISPEERVRALLRKRLLQLPLMIKDR